MTDRPAPWPSCPTIACPRFAEEMPDNYPLRGVRCDASTCTCKPCECPRCTARAEAVRK